MIREIFPEQVLPIRQAVMYPGQPLEMVTLADDDTALHWGLFVDEQLVSVISLFPSGRYGQSLQFRKFATVAEEQGKGYGSELLNAVIQYAEDRHYEYIWCNARLSALDFYLRFGFSAEGEVWQKNGIDFIILKKEL